MMRKGALLVLGLALAACTTEGPGPGLGPHFNAPPPPPPPPVASIVGRGAYHTRSGARGDCAGQSVALMRDTPDFRQRVAALYGSIESARLAIATVKARSARLGPAGQPPLVDSVPCAADGAFAFHTVAPGSYFLIARVKVTSAAGVADDLVIMRHVAVADGETRDVSLAP